MGFEVKRVRWQICGNQGRDLESEAAELYAEGWRMVAAIASGTYASDRELWFEREVPPGSTGPTGHPGPTGPTAGMVSGNRAGVGGNVNCQATGECCYPSCYCPARPASDFICCTFPECNCAQPNVASTCPRMREGTAGFRGGPG